MSVRCAGKTGRLAHCRPRKRPTWPTRIQFPSPLAAQSSVSLDPPTTMMTDMAWPRLGVGLSLDARRSCMCLPGSAPRLCAGRLDAALASGVEPTSDRLLARRAAQLTNPRTRERFADALDACVAHARRPKPRSSLAVPISRDVLFIQGRLAPPRTGPARHWRGLRTRHGACPADADRRRESHIHRRPVQHARARGRRCRRMSGR